MKKQAYGHVSMLIMGLILGVNYWISKVVLNDFNAFQIVSIRVLASTLLFVVFDLLFKKEEKFTRREYVLMFLAGILGVTINQTMFFVGLKYSSPVETSILHTLSPLLVAFFANIILKEKITTTKIIGIILGLAGTLIILTGDKEVSFSNLHFLGNLAIIANIIAYSLFLVVLKPVTIKHNPLTVTKYVFIFGTLTFMPFGLSSLFSLNVESVSMNGWLSMLYVVIGATFLSYFLKSFALQYLSATSTGFYIYVQPFIATLIGYLTGKETLTNSMIIASIFLFLGIWLVFKD